MGFKQVDIVPLATISPITPPGKPDLHKVFQVSRTDTVASVKALVPAQSSILYFILHGSVNSNAATTASVTIQVSDNSGIISTGSVDVKANGATTAIVQMTNLPNVEPVPLNGDLTITAIYAETGTASTAGGPWKISIAYAA